MIKLEKIIEQSWKHCCKREREIACFEQFLLLTQYFQKLSPTEAPESIGTRVIRQKYDKQEGLDRSPELCHGICHAFHNTF